MKTIRIKLLTDMTSCITDGSRTIPKGTTMVQTQTILQWTYFKGDGFTLIIMGWSSSDWDCVEILP